MAISQARIRSGTGFRADFDGGKFFADAGRASIRSGEVGGRVRHLRESRKEKPLLYGSGGGRGDPGHLTMEYFRMQAGFEGVHVPYKGNAEVVMGLVGGQIQAGFLATPGVLPSVQDGRLKALAVSSQRRIALAPEIPTIEESGYPGFEVGFYQVMLAPPGIPESVRTMLEREVRPLFNPPKCRSGCAGRSWSRSPAAGRKPAPCSSALPSDGGPSLGRQHSVRLTDGGKERKSTERDRRRRRS